MSGSQRGVALEYQRLARWGSPCSLGIHVNPPSFVRSLRHFGIAENLRPGDENLRYLRFKKWYYVWQPIVRTQPNFRAFSTFCFSACAQRSMVGEIIMWLARTRDYILQFYARSFPTYVSHHDDANMKARSF